MPKFQWGGATEKSQSTKKCLNFNGGGYSATEKSQSTKKCLNFNGGGGILLKNQFKFQLGGGNLQLKSQSGKFSDNFHFQGGGILKLTWYSLWVQTMCYIFYFIFKYYSLFH